MYRLAVSRPNPQAKEAHLRAFKAWREKPWWHRWRGKPKEGPIIVDLEDLPGLYATLDDAERAAERAADTLPAIGDTGVAILNSEGTEVGGYWCAGGGSF